MESVSALEYEIQERQDALHISVQQHDEISGLADERGDECVRLHETIVKLQEELQVVTYECGVVQQQSEAHARRALSAEKDVEALEKANERVEG